MGLHYTFETMIDQLETWFPKSVCSLRFLDSSWTHCNLKLWLERIWD